MMDSKWKSYDYLNYDDDRRADSFSGYFSLEMYLN